MTAPESLPQGHSLDREGTRLMLLAAADAVLAEVDALTHADQATGDGDHGIGMARGFTAVTEKLAGDFHDFPTPASLLAAVGKTLMLKVGGSSGAIFGTLFLEGAKRVEGDTLDAAGFARFLTGGLEAVQKRGGAKPGDKTMVDALEPAARAAAANTHESLAACLAAAAEAAHTGMDATKHMIATLGRAKTLGDRVLGHADPGAMSLAMMLKGMSKGLRQ